MDNLKSNLQSFGSLVIQRLLSGPQPKIDPQVMQQGVQALQTKFQNFAQTAPSILSDIRANLVQKTLQPPRSELRFISPEEVAQTRFLKTFEAPETQAIQNKFKALYGDVNKILSPRFEAFTSDLEQRLSNVTQRYIQPVKQYGLDVASFAGIGETPEGLRRRQNFAQRFPEPKTEEEKFQQMAETAINFSPMGVTSVAGKALTPAQKVAMQKMKGLLNYTGELIKRGMTKAQAEKMGFKQATKWIENFDSSANRSMRFLNEQMQEAKILKDPMNAAKEIDNLIQTSDVKKKVNLLDYFRTPDRILEKMGLKKESDLIKQKYNDYLDELPKEIDRITQWSKGISADGNIRIFQWLDGKKVSLADSELKVAQEIKGYLKSWADRLGLPEDKRVSSYITHIFEKGVIEKEFDPEVASIIRNKVAGSVYDPFLKRRVNAPEYIEDTWRALDAYVKRAVRKVHMDKALEQVKAKAENLEDSQYNYVKSYIDRINLRPTEIDNLIDNFIKSSPFGYRAGQRPLTVITQNARRMVYRGLLGLNVKTALLNLTQGANTYAKLGEKYTVIGYMKVLQNMPKFLLGKGTELHDVGILRNNIIEDRTLNATKQTMQKVDEGLFYLFNLAEKINRGAAYWGAKSQAIAKGMDEKQAIEYARDLVRKTQFTFGSVDTPLALSSDLAKTFGQFQSFTLKQGEFLGEMAKNKDIAGMVRWVGASLFMVSTIGRLWGMKVEDLIPTVRIGVPPTLQLPYGGVQAITQDKDRYGNPLTLQERILNRDVTRGTVNYIPAGAQGRKLYEGIKTIQEGGSYTDSGRLRYPVEGIQPAIFGPGTTPGAQQYFDDGKPLSEAETETYKLLINSGYKPTEAHQLVVQSRAQKPDLQPKQGFDLFGLFQAKKSEVTKLNPTGNPLIDAVLEQKEISKNEKIIKDIFDLGLSKEETEKVLQQQGLTWETASIIMMKGLGVENGQRGKLLKKTLSGLSNGEYQKTVFYLAENGVLTTGVTAKWLDDGEVTRDQKKVLDDLIAYTKGTKDTPWGNAPKPKKLKLLPVRNIRPTIKKTAPLKLKVPKLKSKTQTFKPLTVKKIKSRSKGGVLYG